MYIVEWCDYEGNLHEWEYENLHDAIAEYEFLDQFHDFVQVVRK